MFWKKNARIFRPSSPFMSFLKIHWQEIVGLLSVAALVFFAACCFSFNPQDPSPYFFSSSLKTPTNWCGFFGASLAARAFHWFGLSIFLLLFFAASLILNLFRKESGIFYVRKLVGFAIFFFGFLMMQKFFSTPYIPTIHQGVFSAYLSLFFETLIGLVGTILLACSLMWIGTLLLLERSLWSSVLTCLAYAQTITTYLARGIKRSAAWCWKASRTLVRSMHTRYLSIKNKRTHNQDAPAQEELCDLDSVTIEKEIQMSEPLHFEAVHVTSSFSSEQINAPRTNTRTIFNKVYSPLRTTLSIHTHANVRIILHTFHTNMQHKKEQLATAAPFRLPDITLFKTKKSSAQKQQQLKMHYQTQAQKLEEKLIHFGVQGEVSAIHPGPVVTLFEYTPAIGTKISKIVCLEDDLAMVLKAKSIRIRAPIPGRAVVGFEISNDQREEVLLSEIIQSEEFEKKSLQLPLALGVDIVGRPMIEDLLTMPHLLVAGSTGSGKSVGLNGMLMSLLCARRPDEMRLVLIDPKRLEFATYKDIPHLLFPIVTDPRSVAPVLKWIVEEMERRYEKMALAGVRNLLDYREISHSLPQQEKMPFIVIVIDELADLMMVAGKDIETLLARISQMARAAGIHIIIATQRPSVDVLTGVIKVNFPSRISFRVSSKIDSKTIMDASGAEKLLGKGDMLLSSPSSSEMIRIHGAYVSDEEIAALTTHLRSQGKAHYLDLETLIKKNSAAKDEGLSDELYREVLAYLETVEEISISMLQRKYRIGFNRSARLIEQLEIDGVLAPAQGSKPRKVLR